MAVSVAATFSCIFIFIFIFQRGEWANSEPISPVYGMCREPVQLTAEEGLFEGDGQEAGDPLADECARPTGLRSETWTVHCIA